jgi:hypothetical protein
MKDVKDVSDGKPALVQELDRYPRATGVTWITDDARLAAGVPPFGVAYQEILLQVGGDQFARHCLPALGQGR